RARQRDLVAVGRRSGLGLRFFAAWLLRARHARLVAHVLFRMAIAFGGGAIGRAFRTVLMLFALLGVPFGLDGRDVRQHAGVMIHMLQVIFDVGTIAVDLRIARHIAVLLAHLQRVMLLARQVLLLVAATTAAALISAAAAAAMSTAVPHIVLLTHHCILT